MIALLDVIAWPLVAVIALCCAIGVAYVWRHPFMAGARLDAIERRLAEHSSVLEALGRVDTSELDRVRLVLRRSGST